MGLKPVGRIIVEGKYNDGNIYRLCYIRGTEGILIGLAEQLGDKTSTDILEKK